MNTDETNADILKCLFCGTEFRGIFPEFMKCYICEWVVPFKLLKDAWAHKRVEELEKQSETARQEFAKEIKAQSELYEKQLKVYREALKFYADPETYFAIGFFPDRPCGEFMSDFSKCADSSKPGKRARKALAQHRRPRQDADLFDRE